jgi:hypothetical protein
VVQGIKSYSFNVLNRPKTKKAAFYSEAASLCSYQAETFAAVVILNYPSIIFKGKAGLPGTRKQYVEISAPGEVYCYLRMRSVWELVSLLNNNRVTVNRLMVL